MTHPAPEPAHQREAVRDEKHEAWKRALDAVPSALFGSHIREVFEIGYAARDAQPVDLSKRLEEAEAVIDAVNRCGNLGCPNCKGTIFNYRIRYPKEKSNAK